MKRNFTLKEARGIGKKLRVKFDKFSVSTFRQGLNVELEHGLVDCRTNVTNDSAILTGKIALAHLNESPLYYRELAKLEKKLED